MAWPALPTYRFAGFFVQTVPDVGLLVETTRKRVDPGREPSHPDRPETIARPTRAVDGADCVQIGDSPLSAI
jgi:hypothetical protein